VGIGDEVNTAARLASQAAAGEILVSEQALKKAGIGGGELEPRSLELKEGISAPDTRTREVLGSRI
jgi:class 3 adenylate cyclase